MKPALVKWIRIACHYVAVDWFTCSVKQIPVIIAILNIIFICNDLSLRKTRPWSPCTHVSTLKTVVT